MKVEELRLNNLVIKESGHPGSYTIDDIVTRAMEYYNDEIG